VGADRPDAFSMQLALNRIRQMIDRPNYPSSLLPQGTETLYLTAGWRPSRRLWRNQGFIADGTVGLALNHNRMPIVADAPSLEKFL